MWGLEVIFKGKNFIRLLGGLGTALEISLIAVAISIPTGIILGILMAGKNPIIKAILRIYLDFIRIMPQLVLLFLPSALCRPVGNSRENAHHAWPGYDHRRE